MNTATLVLAPRPDAGDDRVRAFLVARRHSRRVRVLRRALEVSVAGTVLVSVALIFVHNFSRLRDVTFEGVGFEGGRITMDRPHLTGSRPGGGGYDITAVKAMQDPRHPGAVDLALIGGQITSGDRGASRLSASSGHYEGSTESLDLTGDVKLQNPKYEIFLNSVHIEFKKGDYVSKEAVRTVIQPDTEITADTFEVHDGGAHATFAGHVRTLIQPQTAATP